MDSILEKSVWAYTPKTGDIKVDSADMQKLLGVLETYHDILGNMLERLDPEERKALDNGMVLAEYMQNKYMALSEARQKQKHWYDVMKKFDDPMFTKNENPVKVDELRREVWGWYLEAKLNRENLERDVEKFVEKQGI